MFLFVAFSGILITFNSWQHFICLLNEFSYILSPCIHLFGSFCTLFQPFDILVNELLLGLLVLQKLFHFFFVLLRLVPVPLPKPDWENSETDPTDEEVNWHHILDPCLLIGRIGHCTQEEAPNWFSPVVVKKSEIAPDTTYLHHGKCLAYS